MPNFTAGTSFTDGVTNDVTAAKLNALIADAVPTSSLSLNSTTGTIANFTSSTANVTNATITNLTNGTTTATAEIITSGTIGTLNSTTATITNLTNGTTTGTAATFTTGTLTTGVIPTLTSTTLITSGTGTASSPAIQPTGDTNTGIFFPAADTIAFSEGGTEAMRIDSSGNVGIGVSSLSDKFTVRGITGVSTTIDMSSGISTGTEYGSLKFTASSPNFTGAEIRGIHTNGGTNLGVLAFHTSATERLRIDSSGNVGIGTTSPNATLQVARSTSQTDIDGVNQVATFVNTSSDTSGNLTGIRLGQDNATNVAQGFIGLSSTGNVATRANLVIATPNTSGNSTERLRIDSSGRVGIGTSSPAIAYRMSLTGDGSTIVGGLSLTNAGITYIGAPSANSSAFEIWNAADNYVRIGTNNTERLRITSGGNVLVGTTADEDHKICVNHSNPTSGGGGIRINQTVTGTGRAIQFVYQTSTQVGSITTTASATAYNTSSDYRLKTNLEPISDGIDRLKQLPVYRFNWIADESGNKVDGFVAHEAQAIVPECVTGEKDAVDADGKPVYQGIDQSKIVPLLTAALKEAIAKIETLEAKVTALEAA